MFLPSTEWYSTWCLPLGPDQVVTALLGFSTQWPSSAVYQHRFLFRPPGLWHIRLQYFSWWRTLGTIFSTELFIGVHSTRLFTKFTISIPHHLVWPPNMLLLLKWWFSASGPSAPRSSGVLWLVTCIFSLCISGLCCACSRLSMPTVATNFLGVFTISCLSGLVLIITTSTMRNSLGTTQAASAGGTTSLTPNTLRMPWSAEEGKRRKQRRHNDLNVGSDSAYFLFNLGVGSVWSYLPDRW